MRILSAHTSPIGSIAFSPDGALLAEGVKNSKVRIWNLAKGECIFELNHLSVENPILVSFSPDGRFLDVASTWMSRISLNDFACDTKQDLLMSFGIVRSVEHAPSGRELLLVNYQYLRSSSDGEPLPAFPFPPDWQPQPSRGTFCTSAVYSPDSNRVAFGVSKTGITKHQILLFDCYGNEPVLSMTWKSHEAKRLSFHPTRPLLAAACGPTLRVWNLDSATEVAAIKVGKLHHMAAAFSPCGRFLAAVSKDQTVRFWDAFSFTETATFEWQIGKLLDFAFAPDGSIAAASGDQGKIVLFDVE